MSETITFTRDWTCPECGQVYKLGDTALMDSCCGRNVLKKPTYKDRVQVNIMGNKRDYTYLKGDLDLQLGDTVEVPLRQMRVLGTVTALESEYGGECKAVLRRVAIPVTKDTLMLDGKQ